MHPYSRGSMASAFSNRALSLSGALPVEELCGELPKAPSSDFGDAAEISRRLR